MPNTFGLGLSFLAFVGDILDGAEVQQPAIWFSCRDTGLGQNYIIV